MTANDPLDDLHHDPDYDKLIQQASPALQRYIRTLEMENARLRQELLELRQSAQRRQRVEAAVRERSVDSPTTQLITPRHPDDVQVVTITSRGLAKRTPLNDYATQRRGGIGVFDILAPREDLVAHLFVTRATAALLLLSNRGRAFRLPLDTLPLTDVRGRGASLPERLLFTSDESIAAVLPLDDNDPRTTVLIATEGGWLRTLHRNYVGPRLQPGTLLSDPHRGGAPAAMTLSNGASDVLMVLRSGAGYRFSERQAGRDGVRGIQARPDDRVVGVVSVRSDDDHVLLVTADGQGTRRQMAGFAANKTPGGQGKVIMKTDALVGAVAVNTGDEALCISGFAKIIRFAADEVPAKTGNVQGVAVLDTRGDTLAALAAVPAPETHP